MSTLVVSDDAMIAHDPGPGHPERPDRLRAILEKLARDPIAGTTMQAPAEADLAAIHRVHEPGLVERIEGARGRSLRLDPDTSMSPGSAHAARLAAGAATRVVDAVMTGAASNAFALVRPPGHHAEPNRAMGFCLYNNIAIAAAHAASAHGLERILVVDWDVHHGNGTQAAFYDRPDVLFFSAHQYPFYPGTGSASERGRAAGEGYCVNLPLPGGCRDGDYVRAFEDLLVPIADAYRPQLVLVSAGFDAHAADPLGGMALSTDVYAQLCAIVAAIAQRHAGGRIALLLEGGYDLDALADSVHACIRILAGASAPGVRGPSTSRGEASLRAAIDAQRKFWSIT